MHSYTIYVFFLLQSSYMFRQCCHPQEATTAISLEQIKAILTKTALLTQKHIYIYMFIAPRFDEILV